MQKTNNPQINTKQYWNQIYTTPAKLEEYWDDTARFPAFVKLVKNGDKVLDMGCGVSVPGKTILKEKSKCEVWGVDISDEIIELNKEEYPKGKWYQGYTGYCDFLPDDYFDIMFAGELIEHLDEPGVAFKEAPLNREVEHSARDGQNLVALDRGPFLNAL